MDSVIYHLYLSYYLLLNCISTSDISPEETTIITQYNHIIKVTEVCPFQCASIVSYHVDHNGGTFYNKDHNFVIVIPPELFYKESVFKYKQLQVILALTIYQMVAIQSVAFSGLVLTTLSTFQYISFLVTMPASDTLVTLAQCMQWKHVCQTFPQLVKES